MRYPNNSWSLSYPSSVWPTGDHTTPVVEELGISEEAAPPEDVVRRSEGIGAVSTLGKILLPGDVTSPSPEWWNW